MCTKVFELERQFRVWNSWSSPPRRALWLNCSAQTQNTCFQLKYVSFWAWDGSKMLGTILEHLDKVRTTHFRLRTVYDLSHMKLFFKRIPWNRAVSIYWSNFCSSGIVISLLAADKKASPIINIYIYILHTILKQSPNTLWKTPSSTFSGKWITLKPT